MYSFEKTHLWRNTLAPQPDDTDQDARSFLRESVLDIRTRAEHLVSAIIRDVPGFTVHDITHLDALWEIASLIAGENYPLNPAEAFVFGVAVLLHDAAMSLAAYPDGISAIKKTPQWRDSVTLLLQGENGEQPLEKDIGTPPDHIAKIAVGEVLRELHATGAERLPILPWPTNNGSEYLIQNADLRHSYGHIIGKIAASHWWPTSDISTKLPSRVNAGPRIPAIWHVDPVRIACLLRTADAAHIDHRRAPTFLKALLRPTGVSEEHWTFQSKLGKPSISSNYLIYTGGPFNLAEAEAWWLCYDMFSIIDKELRASDSLLEACGTIRFAARGVQGANSPETISKLVTTDKWSPVDTELRVSDVPALIELLGGTKLYGTSQFVPIREMIQNAADAIRAKRLILGDVSFGEIKIKLAKNELSEWILTIEDNGIGMSRAVLAGALLDFGRSFWSSSAVRREFPGLVGKGLKPTGRYGIGFFSVFMLGDRVSVTSRRHDAAATDAVTLDFRNGLKTRPILRQPSEEEALSNPGTRIRIVLRIPADHEGGLIFGGTRKGKVTYKELRDIIERIAPSLDVTVKVDSGPSKTGASLTANDWRNVSTQHLVRRFTEVSSLSQLERFPVHLTELIAKPGGQCHGRAGMIVVAGFDTFGSVTVGGLHSANLFGVAGAILGEPRTVARNTAMPTAPAPVLRSWAAEQAGLFSNAKTDVRVMLRFTSIVLTFGFFPRNLPIARRDFESVTCEQLAVIATDMDKFYVYEGVDITYDDYSDGEIPPRDFDVALEIDENLYFSPNSEHRVLMVGEERWPDCVPDLYIGEHPRTCIKAFATILAEVWGSNNVIEQDDEICVGKVYGKEVARFVKAFWRKDA